MKKRSHKILGLVLIVFVGLYLLETAKNIYTYMRFVRPKIENIFHRFEGEEGSLKGIWEEQSNAIVDHNWLVYKTKEIHFFSDSAGIYLEKVYPYLFNSNVHSWSACLPHNKKPYLIYTYFVRIDRDDPNYLDLFPLKYITESEGCFCMPEISDTVKIGYNHFYKKYMLKNDSLYISDGFMSHKYYYEPIWLVNPIGKYPFYVYFNPFFVRNMPYYP